MANTLMFEVGIKSAKEQLEKIKQEFKDANGELNKLLNIKVHIDGVEAITNALSQIRDTTQLKNLRQEIENLNREFSKMAVGAGGSGDLGLRAAAQDAAELKSHWQSAERTLQRMKNDLADMRISRDKLPFGSQERTDMGGRIATLKKQIEEQEKIAQSAKSAYKSAADGVDQVAAANTKAEASFKELKTDIDKVAQSVKELSGQQVNVNLGGEFKTWAQEVQTLVAHVKELVTQFEKLNSVHSNGNVITNLSDSSDNIKKTTQDVSALEKQIKELAEGPLKKYLEYREKLESLSSNWRNRPDALGLGDVQKQKHDLLDMAGVLNKFAEKKGEILKWGGPSGSNTGRLIAEKDAVAAIAKEYKITNDEAAKYLKLIMESEMVSRKYHATLADGQLKIWERGGTPGYPTTPANQARERYYFDLQADEFNKHGKQVLEYNSLLQQLEETKKKGAVSTQQQTQQIQQQAQVIQQAAQATQQLAQAESKAGETSGFAELDRIIRGLEVEVNKIVTAFSTLGNSEGIGKLKENLEGINSAVATLKDTFANFGSVTKQNEQSLKGEADVTGNTKQEMEGLASAKKNVTDAEKQQSRANEQNAQTLKQEGEQANKTSAFLEKVAKEAQNASDSSKKSGSQQAASVNSLLVKYATLIQRIENWQGVLSKMLNAGGHSNYFDKQIESAIKGYQQLKEILMSISKGEKFNLNGKEFFLDMDYHTLSYLRSVMTYLGVSFANVNKEASLFNKNADKGMRAAADSMRKAGREADNLETKLEKLNIRGVRANAVRAGVDVSGLDAAIARLERYQRVLEYIYNSEGKHDASRIIGSVGYRQANNDLSVQIESVKHLTSEKLKAGEATSRQIVEEQKLAQAIGHSTNEMKNQSMVLSDLKSMAYQYLSIWGAQSFINNIIETGGLLEQQRLSIGAILQNAGQATELFGKIKQLALKSPFGVVELDKMSKQLTAYGFEYKELYDWTKRLADISAATGTSVDRLALALGHVRAEGALSGYTLRQFAMGNVPLLRMLAENLNITTKQVREKVRKKDISYEDVMNVLKQLTDKGGMFYEAQETMSQALNAKFKNLRDAFDIMYNEIAEGGVGDALKELAGVLTTGAKHWRELGNVILWTGGAFGIAKAAMLIYNQALGTGTAATLKSAAADKQKQVNMLRLAKEYRALSASEWQLLATHSHWYATSGKLTSAQLSLLLSEKKLGQEELYRAVALRKINKELALKAALEMKTTTAAERHYKAELLWGLRSVQTVSRVRAGWIMLGNAIRTAGAALWSFTKMVLPMAAFSAIVELFARTNQMIEQSKEAAHDLAEKATSDMKALNETFNDLQSSNYIKLSEKSGKYINGHRVVTMDVKFKDEELQKGDLTDEIASLKNKLQDMSPMYEGDLVDIDKMDSQVKQFKAIVNKLESIRHANDVTEAMSDVVMDANVDSAGPTFLWKWGDTYAQNMKDYENRMKDMERYVNSINEETIDGIDKELNGELSKLQKKYSLDSKNNALGMLFASWSRQGGVPENYKSKIAPTMLEEMYGKATSGGFMGLGENLKGRFEQLEKDTQFMAEKLSSIIANQFKDDPDGAIYAITSYMRKLISVAGITDPRVMEEVRRMMLEEMRKYLPKNMVGSVADAMQVKILQEQFMTMLGSSITETSSQEEIDKAYEAAKEGANKWGEMMGYDMERLGEKAGDAYNDALQAKLNSVQLKVDWQKRASKIFVQNVSIKSNFDKNLDEFAQAVQKDLKEKQAYLDRNKQHLKMTFNIDTDIIMNADKLKTFMDKLAEQSQKKAMEGDWEGAQAINSKIDKELKPYYDALMAVQEDKAWLKSEGFPEKDPTKGNKGNGEDKNAKAVRERVRVIKEAADAFQYWREKVGEKGAWAHVQREFGKVLNDIGITADNIEDVRGHLKRITGTNEFKAIKDQKVKTEIKKEIAKDNDQFIRKDFEKSTKDWVSAMSRDIEELTRKWDVFNSVVSETGDRMLAARISGLVPGANPADIKRWNISSAVGADIDFDSVLGMSEQQIKDYVITLGVAEEEIQAITDGLKDWQKAQQELIKSDIQNYAKWLGSLVDYQTMLNKKQEEFAKIVEETQRLLERGEITDSEAGRRTGAAAVKYNNDVWQMQSAYKNLYNNALGMARDEFAEAYAKEIEQLNKMLGAGLITVEDYTEKVKKLNRIQQEFGNQGYLGIGGGVGAYLSGGYQGLISYHRDRENAKWEDYNTAVNKYGKDSLAAYNAKKDAEDEEEKADAMEKAQKAAEQLAQTFNDLSSGADLLSNMFDALGMEGAAGAFGDAAGVLGGIGQGAQSLSALGPWGMAAGGILGGITSIAQLNDKKHEQRIQELKKEVSKIDNTLQTIKALRERELGYDSGSLRRQLAAQYQAQERKISLFGSQLSLTPSVSGMSEYYGRYSGGNGYSQEYNALVETRKKYMEMYEEENAKKKSSSEALEEYKTKIAALDEQIMFFTQDLAKELWSIDIQGWADQIGDALWTAFENGEDAVEAFGDTARDIISNVAKNMWELSVLEPMFKDLQEALFGKNGQRGTGAIKFDSNGNIDMKASEQPTLDVLGQYFGKNGIYQQAIEGGEQFYDWVQKITGIDLSKEDSSNASASIKNITEETGDLLASYLNACRADVAANRAMIADYFPQYLAAMTSGNANLANIENHTAAIMRSNDVIAEKITSLDNNFNALRNKAWKMPIA